MNQNRMTHNARELFGDWDLPPKLERQLSQLVPDVERLVSELTPEQKRLLGELTPAEKKSFQSICRLYALMDANLEYAFIHAVEEVDYLRNGRSKPEPVRLSDGTTYHLGPEYRYELSEAFDTGGWKKRLEAEDRIETIRRREVERRAQVRIPNQRRAQQPPRNPMEWAENGPWYRKAGVYTMVVLTALGLSEATKNVYRNDRQINWNYWDRK